MQTQSKSDPISQPSEGTQEKKQPQDLCHLDCGTIATERNRYYTGKYMTARDFQDEQDYMLSHHRLHNRLFHGWGIVSGLQVLPHSQPNCSDRYVVVCPGIAIDCCGRELVLRTKTVVKVWDPEQVSEAEIARARTAEDYQEAVEDVEEVIEEIEEEIEEIEGEQRGRTHGRRSRDKREHEEEHHRGPVYVKRGGPFLLVLRYDEEAIEWAPALYSEQACDARQMEANRVREIACVDVLPWDVDRYAGCWTIPEPDRPGERIPCNNDCADTQGQECANTIEPECECKYGVPLALVEPVYAAGAEEWNLLIHKDGRRDLLAATRLTHIVDFNWEHGKDVELSSLADSHHRNAKLRVYFDRPLLDGSKTPPGTGITRSTFIVAVHRREDVSYVPKLLFTDSEAPYIDTSEDSCCAVFPIDDRLFTGNEQLHTGDIVHVTLKCDFIMDCLGHAVDGDHLRGRLPTGNCTEGGTFESWFRVKNDLPQPHRPPIRD
jgi:hypothetical protein